MFGAKASGRFNTEEEVYAFLTDGNDMSKRRLIKHIKGTKLVLKLMYK